MLDYAALNALAAVVREGSFERAARALNVTPSAVSQRIRALEVRAGCVLVVRDQPCYATDAGRALCQHLDRVRLLEHELQGALPAALVAEDGGGEAPRVPLPLAVNADSLGTWFAPAVARFAAGAPVLEVWRTVHTDADEPVHAERAIYRADTFRYRLALER